MESTMEETFEIVQQSIRNLILDFFPKYEEFKLYLRGVFESDGVMGMQEIENKLEKYSASVTRTDAVEIELKNYVGVTAVFREMIQMQTSINIKFCQLRRICKDADDQNKFDALLDEHLQKLLDLKEDVAEFVASQIASSGEILKDLEDILGAIRQLKVAETLAFSSQDVEDDAKKPISKSIDEKTGDENDAKIPTIKSNDEKKNEVKALLEYMWDPKVLMALNLLRPELFMSAVFDDEADKCVADRAVNDQKDENETDPVIAQMSHEFLQDIRQFMVSSKLLVDFIKGDATEVADVTDV